MSSKFSDRQQELLSAAAEREDRLLPKAGAPQKVGAKLVAAGLAKEVKAKAGAPIWRRDTETERVDALKLTALGAKAVAADVKNVSESVDAAASETSPGDRPARRTSRARSNAPQPVENGAEERRANEGSPAQVNLSGVRPSPARSSTESSGSCRPTRARRSMN
jgi:hypothetical protein